MYLIAYFAKISPKLDHVIYKNNSLEYFTHRLTLDVRSLSLVKLNDDDPATKAICIWAEDFNPGSFVVC